MPDNIRVALWGSFMVMTAGLREVIGAVRAVATTSEHLNGDKPTFLPQQYELWVVGLKGHTTLVYEALDSLRRNHELNKLPPTVVILDEKIGPDETNDFLKIGVRGFVSVSADFRAMVLALESV